MTPLEPERLAEIRQKHNDMRRYEPISSREYTTDVRDLLAEVDRLTSELSDREQVTQRQRAHHERLMDLNTMLSAERDAALARLDAGAKDYVRVSGELKATLAQRELALVAGRQFSQQRDELRARVGHLADNMTDCLPLSPVHQEGLVASLRRLAGDAPTEPAAVAMPPTVHCGLSGEPGPAGIVPGGRIVICGSLSQQAALDEVAAMFRGPGFDVLSPTPSDRPAAELDAQWLAAIDQADHVVVVPKPDGSLGAQTTRELIHAMRHGGGPEIVFMQPPAAVDPLAHVQVGDPDPEADFDGPTCDADGTAPVPLSPTERFTVSCTRRQGHPGQHIACGNEVLAVWPPASPDAVTTEGAQTDG